MDYLINLRKVVSNNLSSKMTDIATILKDVAAKHHMVYSGAVKKSTFGSKVILSLSFTVDSKAYDDIDLNKLRADCQKLTYPSLAISNVSKCILIKNSTDTTTNLGYRIQIEFLYTL